MTLADIYQIAQTVSSVAVVASLVFVGLQIRQNTQATRATSHHAVSEALNRLNLLWAQDGEVTRIWLSGMDDREALSPQERWRFDSTVRAYLHVCETMYTQASLGAGDPGIVADNGLIILVPSGYPSRLQRSQVSLPLSAAAREPATETFLLRIVSNLRRSRPQLNLTRAEQGPSTDYNLIGDC